MHRRTWFWLACCGLFISHPIPSRADTACAGPARLAHASVRIIRMFDGNEAPPEEGAAGYQGSGWYLSRTTLVTVAHVAEAMRLSRETWKSVDIRDGDDTRSVPVRIKRIVGVGAEKLAVLELRDVDAVAAARVLVLRAAPLVPDEPIAAPAYSGGRLRLVGGRFDSYADGGAFGAGALLEMYDGKDRLAIDYGASGAPVVDCNGRVVAVVATIVTQTVAVVGPAIRVSTAWGMPNVVSVPIQALQDALQVK
jgi:S1-C subfamily serine protease